MSDAQKLLSYPEFLKINQALMKNKLTRVLVHGVFDILHKGHVQLLVEAKKAGDILYAGIEPDLNTALLKGPSRPIHPQEARAFVMSHLDPIDHVFIIPEYPNKESQNEFYLALYQEIHPDIIATCMETGPFNASKKKNAESLGIKMVNVNSFYEKNTSKMIELLKLNAK